MFWILIMLITFIVLFFVRRRNKSTMILIFQKMMVRYVHHHKIREQLFIIVRSCKDFVKNTGKFVFTRYKPYTNSSHKLSYFFLILIIVNSKKNSFCNKSLQDRESATFYLVIFRVNFRIVC